MTLPRGIRDEPGRRLRSSVMMLLTASGLGACRSLPPLTPLSAAEAAAIATRCRTAFPVGPWEAVHVVEASLPMQQQTSLLGAIATEPLDRGFRSVLMAQEGLVLFDASVHAGELAIHRALSPFDRDGIAAATTRDIALMLFPPSGELTEVGRTSESTPACRWRQRDGSAVELAFPAADQLTLRHLDACGRASRTVVASGLDACGFAHEVQLEAPGAVGYRLRLTLVERTAPNCLATAPAGAVTEPPQDRR